MRLRNYRMRNLVIFCFSTLPYFFSTKAVAQVNLFPAHFGQVLLAKQLLNPALPNIERATNATFSNQFYTGAFSKIDNLYFIGNINLNGKDSARNVNSLGIKFQNEKEGEFVERPKYYLSYSFRTKILEMYWLGLGIDIGRAGYTFKGTDVTTSGSASNWDGNLGIVLHSETFCLAGSANQIFNSMILPKDLYFRWKRFYSIYAEKSFEIGNATLSAYIQNRFIPQQPDVMDIGTNITLANVLVIGTNVWVGRNIGFCAGLKNISIENHHFSLHMSYNLPASNKASANIQSFEMSLYYKLR